MDPEPILPIDPDAFRPAPDPEPEILINVPPGDWPAGGSTVPGGGFTPGGSTPGPGGTWPGPLIPGIGPVVPIPGDPPLWPAPGGTIYDVWPDPPDGTIYDVWPDPPDGTIYDEWPGRPDGTIYDVWPERPGGTITDVWPTSPERDAPRAAGAGAPFTVAADELERLARGAGAVLPPVDGALGRVGAVMAGLDRRGWNAAGADTEWGAVRRGWAAAGTSLRSAREDLLRRATLARLLNLFGLGGLLPVLGMSPAPDPPRRPGSPPGPVPGTWPPETEGFPPLRPGPGPDAVYNKPADEPEDTEGGQTAGGAQEQGEGDEAEEPGRVYEPSPKHGPQEQDSPRGTVGKEPEDGQEALDHSVQVKDTSPRRVGVDKEHGEIVVLDRTRNRPGEDGAPGTDVYHGHVRSWEQLTPQQQNALRRAGLVDKKGRIR